jgi:hypothetical protein
MTFLPIQRSERGWSVLGIGCEVTDLYDGGRPASGSGAP